jgi:hypothetical protein
MARRILASAVLAVLFAAPCSSVCTGWLSSPEARMTCCMGESGDQAMMCCASGESRRNADSTAGFATVALPAPEPIASKVAAAVIPKLRATAAVIDSLDPQTADLPRHVLLSVFLI